MHQFPRDSDLQLNSEVGQTSADNRVTEENLVWRSNQTDAKQSDRIEMVGKRYRLMNLGSAIDTERPTPAFTRNPAEPAAGWNACLGIQQGLHLVAKHRQLSLLNLPGLEMPHDVLWLPIGSAWSRHT
jgi:hypothetical protein